MTPTSPAAAFSSSPTLWATASKEWVIQPKPKPGRKPKKDVPPPVKLDEEVDNKGRRVQNRAAQRAFRERKQSQLAELQARVQSYEQGEIERNVALQNIAKRLKEENEALRLENSRLRERVLKIEQGHETSPGNDKKRLRDDSPESNVSPAVLPSASKRSKVPSDSPRARAPTIMTSFTPSPPSMVSSPDSNGTTDTHFSPLPYDTQSDLNQTSLPHILDFTSSVKSAHLESGPAFPAFDCGFCNEDTPCVCREIAAQQAIERVGIADFKAENYSQPNSLAHVNNSIRIGSPSVPPRTSILENLPAYQPPVPLRRRPAVSTANAIFAVAPPSVLQTTPINCSGDPSNCMACADDAFGKAFCSAIEESVATQVSCVDCPCRNGTFRHDNIPSAPHLDCGRNSTDCGCGLPNQASSMSASSLESSGVEMMPTNDAWRQLKSHPNVAFTDLSLLADVVARRSKCTGPTVVISPALGSVTPERTMSPALPNVPQIEHGPVLLTDPHARYREKERARSSGPSSPPRLVSQDVLLKCGRQAVREVHTDAVRDALRLLDAKFS